MKNSYIGQAWLVLSLALVFGGLLAGVQAGLSGRIAANKRNETYDQIPALVTLRNLETGEVLVRADADKTVEIVTDDGKVVYKVFSADDKHIGWVIKGAGSGFADRIELLIGLNAYASRILGMYVLDQKETPALGDKISKPDFQGRFRDKWTEDKGARAPLVAVRTATGAAPGNDILAVTGATVSSQSVCKIVNKAVDEFKPWLDARAAAEAEQADQADPEEH